MNTTMTRKECKKGVRVRHKSGRIGTIHATVDGCRSCVFIDFDDKIGGINGQAYAPTELEIIT